MILMPCPSYARDFVVATSNAVYEQFEDKSCPRIEDTVQTSGWIDDLETVNLHDSPPSAPLIAYTSTVERGMKVAETPQKCPLGMWNGCKPSENLQFLKGQAALQRTYI